MTDLRLLARKMPLVWDPLLFPHWKLYQQNSLKNAATHAQSSKETMDRLGVAGKGLGPTDSQGNPRDRAAN